LNTGKFGCQFFKVAMYEKVEWESLRRIRRLLPQVLGSDIVMLHRALDMSCYVKNSFITTTGYSD